MKGNFLSDFSNFEHIVELGKLHLIGNGIREYFIGKCRMLETSQWEKREKYRVVSSTVLLALSIPSTL
jgi:hypothetical protein